MIIRSEEILVTLPIMNSSEYPNLPSLPEETTITLNSSEFSKMIKQTVFAVAKDMSKPTLTGVNIVLSNGELKAVATNSQRLAIRSMPIGSDHHVSFTVPGSSLSELIKLLQNDSNTMHIHWSKTHIAFRTEAFTLHSNLIEGIYPETARLIPATFKTNITVDTKHLLNAIERASLFSSGWRNHNVLIEVVDSRIRISSQGIGNGRIEETQPIKMLKAIKKLE